MKHASLLTAAWIAAALLASPTLSSAQTPGRVPRGERPERPEFPTLPPQASAPPQPAGLGGNLPPGFGGPIPTPQTAPPVMATPPSGPSQGRGLPSVCGPGGALSGEAAIGQTGRARARALVCPDG